ncbi:TerD family protein [Bacillus sp. PK3-056]|uniref:TerD family protein n=1 Tax=Niallia circulans TaxID=1397 RepID=UPI000F45D156|nr:TerD family protein [Niallia circulans]AYV70773.1 cytoplasmic protein [Niallia circulans]
MVINDVYLRRKNKLLLNKGNEKTPQKKYIATILLNIDNLGFTLSNDIIEILYTYSISQLNSFYIALVKNLKELVGANKQYNPMYPNFPHQVMDADASELFINAIFHYWSFGSLLPNYNKEERLPLYDITTKKVIETGTEEEFESIFINLLSSKTSISETDKEDLSWFFNEYPDKVNNILPKEIPSKENVALLSILLLHNNINTSVLFDYVKTATDVLRIAVAMSEGDISLATNTKFKSFKRKQRRLLMSLLENCSNIEEDMKRYKNRWIRLGERLHPTEFKKYEKVKEAFTKLRNNQPIQTFNGVLTNALENNRMDQALSLLVKRPGEFARKLDHLIRLHTNPNVILNEFKNVADSVETTVLLQVREHFKNRNNQKEKRTFFPKGNVAKLFVIDNNLPEIEENICNSIVQICENSLVNEYKKRDYLGKVYLDESLKNYLVPFSQRSASKSLKSVVRGSKLDISDSTSTIRSFIYWKENNLDRADIDLSAVMYDDNWDYLEHVSYTNLRSSKYKAFHSGDITSAPHGASEFIDLEIESVRKFGGRYIVLSIQSFTGQTFSELPECFMGWMSRENPNSGEIYEPKTVENRMDVTSEARVSIPMIIDLHENKVIWTDIALRNNPDYYNNVEGNKIGMVLMGKAMTTLIKPNLYELIELNIKARGEKCDNIEEADIVFSINQGVTPFDQDVIVSQYL